MTRQFTHAGRTWEVRSLGVGIGAGTGSWGDITDYLAVFVQAGTDAPQYSATIGAMDPSAVPLEQLAGDLEEALIRYELDQVASGLTAGELAERCGVNAETVRSRLLGMQLHIDQDWMELDEQKRRYFPRSKGEA